MRAWSGVSFPLVIAAALAGLTLWLRQAIDLPEERKDGKLRHDPDTIIESLQAASYDVAGRPLHHLSAERLVHYPDDDTSYLDRPRLHFTPAGASEMRVEAQRGQALGKDEIRLWDGVRVERIERVAGARMVPGWTATVPDLVARTDLGTVQTDSPYVFVQGSARIEGKGFFADQNARLINLVSGVRASFPPRNTSRADAATPR
jgi:lipopolysaccharide export system protein LptC